MINNICEIINQHANENVPRNIWGTFVLRRWGWRLTCQTCDDGRWTQRRPPKPSSWSPSPCCCHKARGRSAGYSRCFPAYRSAISSTCPLSLSSALSSCTPEGSYGTFRKYHFPEIWYFRMFFWIFLFTGMSDWANSFSIALAFFSW